MNPIVIQQAAQWSATGYGRLGETKPPLGAGLPAWNQVCTRAFDRFPRLDPLSKLVGILSEWLLETQPVSPDLGMILATRFGCVEADLAYYHTAVQTPEMASPQLFPYTLPSSGLAEVAIRHQLHGPSLVLLQDEGLGPALSQARHWLESGEAEQCLLLHADALLSAGAQFLQVRPCVEGWGFLLGTVAGNWRVPEPAAAGNLRPREWFAELEKPAR